jgi:hypothetical protein
MDEQTRKELLAKGINPKQYERVVKEYEKINGDNNGK